MIDFKQKIEEEEKKMRQMELKQTDEDLLLSKKNRRVTTYTIAVIVLALIFAGRILMSNTDSGEWFMSGIINNFKHLLPLADKTLSGEETDRINVLLLGIGDTGHAGEYLTDTIMLASLKPSTKQVSLISIPRDLVAPVSNWEKINSIDAYAEAKNPGSGGEVTTKAISTLLQIPIQYYVRVDFSGFVNIVDELGNIKVDVANTLDDYTYPAYGQEDNPDYYARFEHLHIEKGLQTMDGTLALKYARSRHALGVEGSDFARAHRQQLVLEAIKNKLLSTQTLLNPVIVTKIINEFNKNISTNLSAWELLRAWNLFKDVDSSKIINTVLSDAPDSFLVSGRGQNGAYILTPRSGNFGNIQALVQNIFSSENKQTITATPTITDGASVIILNGTWIGGLAGKTAVLLEQAKFKVLETKNASVRDSSQTLVYDLSAGSKKNSLAILKKITGAISAFDHPDWLSAYEPDIIKDTAINTGQSNGSITNENLTAVLPEIATVTPSVKQVKPDFLIIVGTDSNKAE